MEKRRSRFVKWLAPNGSVAKAVSRTKSTLARNSLNAFQNLVDNRVSKSLDRSQSCMDIDSNKDEIYLNENKQIFSTLQPDIYASLDFSCSDSDNQSSTRTSTSQNDLENTKKELIIRTNTVTVAFDILEEIYKKSMEFFAQSSCEKFSVIERIFKDLSCMKGFHQLYETELNSIINNDLPLSLVFSNQVINSSMNWYKIFYTSFETRNQLLTALYSQNEQFKSIADEVIVHRCEGNPSLQFANLPWILCSIKDSLFHFEILLTRYSEYLEDCDEKIRIGDSIKMIQNVLLSCNMQCDYNAFLKTQNEYNLLSTTEPLNPSIRFVHKGNVLKVCGSKGHLRLRTIFLFTHTIYITRKNVQFHSFKIKHQLLLSSCNFYIIPVDKHKYQSKGFRIESKDFSCEFFVEKETEFYVWIEKLNSTICQARMRKKSFDKKILKYTYDSQEESTDNEVNPGVESPRWQHPSKTNFCNGFSCSTKFEFTDRRTHCAADGLIYCEKCVTYSAPLAYCNKIQNVCRECYELLTDPSMQYTAKERQLVKLKRIKRNGLINGWLTISKISPLYMDSVEIRQRLYCVLNSDCTIYTYELPEDKYHQLPIRVVRAVLCSPVIADDSSMFGVIKIRKSGVTYTLEAESQKEALEWIQCVKLSQLENIQNL